VDLSDYLAVPYVAVFYSEESEGRWLRYAEYPELPGCVGVGVSAVEALDNLEAERIRMLVAAHARGEDIPVPRPPLASRVSGLTGQSTSGVLGALTPEPGEDGAAGGTASS
jgi:predicted RNase H-like HicB family nuclease